MLTENQVTVKLEERKENVIYAKLRSITQGTDSQIQRLFHTGQELEMQFYPFLTKEFMHHTGRLDLYIKLTKDI